MTEVLKTSVVCRWLQALWRWLGNLPSGSVFAAAWDGSGLRRFCVGVRDHDDPCLHASRMDGAVQSVSRWLSLRSGLGACVRESFLGRLAAGLLRWCQNSVSLRWLTRDGFTGILLTVLGLYAGVDWLLRDVLSVPVLSSLWDEILLAVCLIWILWQRTDRPKVGNRSTSLDLFVLTFLMMALALMILVSPRMSIAVSGYRAACQYLLWFFVVTRLIRNDGDFTRLYRCMLFLAAVIALHGVYQYIVAAPIPEHWTDQAEQSVRTRVYSIFGSPNIMACFMVMFAPMAAGSAYASEGWKGKLLGWGLVLLLGVSCLFTMSRGGWVAMAVAIVIFALLVDRRLLGLLIVAGIASLTLPFVASRIGYLFTDDFAQASAHGGRESRWALGMDYLYRFGNPAVGMGFGVFGGAVAMQNQIHKSYLSYFYMDNYYMKTLVETGYVGLTTYLLMLVGLLGNGLRSLGRCAMQKDRMYPLSAGLFAGICGTLTHCYWENIFEEPYMLATFWIMAAMLIYAGMYRKKT